MDGIVYIPLLSASYHVLCKITNTGADKIDHFKIQRDSRGYLVECFSNVGLYTDYIRITCLVF